MGDFLVSVVVPIYNVEACLNKCIDSLVNQSLSQIEIILVDDGSKDQSAEICKLYAEKYDNIRFYSKSNGGVSSARNYGVERAKSEWIIFVDSDDYVEPRYVEDIWRVKSDTGADMVVGAVEREYSEKVKEKINIFEPYCVSNIEAINKVYGEGEVGWEPYHKLIRRECLLKHPFPDGYYEDTAIMYRLLWCCKKIAICDFRYNYHYMYREGSILGSVLSDKHYRTFEVCDEFWLFNRKYLSGDVRLDMLYKKSTIVQILTLQKMSYKQYRYIYNKYKKIFRKNSGIILKDRNISRVTKFFYLELCLIPEIFYVQQLARKVIRKSCGV